MRSPTGLQKLEAFMAALGRQVTSPGRVYLTGGACALLHAWRATTLDIDLKAEPEPDGFFEAIAVLKEQLNVNVELAAPAPCSPWTVAAPLDFPAIWALFNEPMNPFTA